ncbi:MAG: hypothetical protein ACXIU8_06925 [Alkalilacustris sp.]
MTAEDVAFPFGPERMLGEDAPQRATAGRLWPTLDRVEIVDDRTVRFVTSEPDVNIETRLAMYGLQIMSRRAAHARQLEIWHHEEPGGARCWTRTPSSTGCARASSGRICPTRPWVSAPARSACAKATDARHRPARPVTAAPVAACPPRRGSRVMCDLHADPDEGCIAPPHRSLAHMALARAEAPLLRAEGLQLAFETPRGNCRVLHGVDLAIARGGAHGLVGESGSGKSVICLAMLGLLGPRAAVGAAGV